MYGVCYEVSCCAGRRLIWSWERIKGGKVITRHPMRQEELEQTLSRWTPEQVSHALAELKASKRVQVVECYDIRFWGAAASHYANKSHAL